MFHEFMGFSTVKKMDDFPEYPIYTSFLVLRLFRLISPDDMDH